LIQGYGSTLYSIGAWEPSIYYGVVHLLEVAVKATKRSKEWKVFQCIQGGEIVVTEVAAKEGYDHH